MGFVLKPGQTVRPKRWVLGWELTNGEEGPIVGRTYTVRDVRLRNDGKPEITLNEIVNPVLDYEVDGRNEVHFQASDFEVIDARTLD